MKERNLSYYLGIIVVPLIFLQIIGYAYDKHIAFPFNDTLYNSVSVVLGILRIVPALESAKTDILYWVICYVAMFLILLFVPLMVYVDYSIRIGKFLVQFPATVLKVIIFCFYWVLMTPITEAFIEIFVCKEGKSVIVNDMVCW